jgi:hypothetical protein
MNILFNNTGEMIDVLIKNNVFNTTLYTKVGEFLAQDILNILIEEKPGLNDYHTVKITRIIQEVRYYQVHISCTFNGFMVCGSENIVDLPKKIRQKKLEKILNE